MRAQWEKALRGLDNKLLDTPTASPYAVSFFTLPQHWRLVEEIRNQRPAANVLPGGDFEAPLGQIQSDWQPQESTLDAVTLLAARVNQVRVDPPKAAPAPSKGLGPLSASSATTPKPAPPPPPAKATLEPPKEGKQCLMLQIKPKNPEQTPRALERTFLAINSPTVRLQPGTLVQISGWVRIPGPITASPDGALLYDSAGGEPLAVRLTDPTPWKKFTLYRRVPASGAISVTLALTGLGSAYFDDIRIEPLVPATATVKNEQGGSRK
jgi:hypothetical protein